MDFREVVSTALALTEHPPPPCTHRISHFHTVLQSQARTYKGQQFVDTGGTESPLTPSRMPVCTQTPLWSQQPFRGPHLGTLRSVPWPAFDSSQGFTHLVSCSVCAARCHEQQ